MPRKIAIISLGCSRNVVDSEKILADYRRRGYELCSSDKAQTILLNTCAFTKEAKQESIDCLLDLIDLKNKGKIKKIFVYGCLAERYARELKINFKEVDGFFGIADFKKQFDRNARITPKHSAYIKISEGCANFCSYCAIPAIKGPLKSRDVSSILKEVEFLEKDGVRELNVVGQDITLFGQDKSGLAPKSIRCFSRCEPLVALLKKILESSDIPWIRLLYLNPLRVSDELLSLMSENSRICPYLDVPLQHANDRILELMNRAIDKKTIFSLINKIRNFLPESALRTTFIVGFPSETDREFQELLDFVKSVSFDRCGAFQFSAEENTRAYSFKNKVKQEIVEERYDRLMALQKTISERLLKKEVGKVLDVLIDENRQKTDGVVIGRTAKDAPEVDGVVYLKSKKPLKRGALVCAKITDNYEYDLCGEVV
jgi:ribosomal protein S12 methylthiotransferase